MHLNSSAPFITCLLYHSQSKVGTRAGSIIYTVRYLTYCIICSTAAGTDLVSTSSTSSAQTTPLRTRSYKNASPPPPPPAAAAAFQTGRPFPDAYGRRWASTVQSQSQSPVQSGHHKSVGHGQRRAPQERVLAPCKEESGCGLGGRRAARLNHSSSARLAGLGLPAAERPSCGSPRLRFLRGRSGLRGGAGVRAGGLGGERGKGGRVGRGWGGRGRARAGSQALVSVRGVSRNGRVEMAACANGSKWASGRRCASTDSDPAPSLVHKSVATVPMVPKGVPAAGHHV